MEEMQNVQINEDDMINKVATIMNRINENRELQSLADEHGLSVNNSVKLNNATIDNIAVTTIALLLAKQANDPKYQELVKVGMQKREIKFDIVNTYKNQANQILEKYKTRVVNNIQTH